MMHPKRIWAPDTETELMRPGLMAPEMVCLTWDCIELPSHERHGAKIATPDVDAKDVFEKMLDDRDSIIVGQNVAYDMAVLGAAFPGLVTKIFEAYRANRITDTKIRQQLIDIAEGCFRGYLDEENVWHKHGYSLFDLVRRHQGKLLKKDGWRLRYGRFIGVHLADWPNKAKELQAEARVLLEREAFKPEAERYYDGHDPKDLLAILADPPEQCLTYPLDDATTTLDVYLAQERHADRSDDARQALMNEYFETYAAFVLHLCSVWGVHTDEAGVSALAKQTAEASKEIEARLIAEGLVRPNGTRDTKKAAEYMATVCEREGLPLRKTAKGGVCLDSDACQATGDPVMKAYTDFSQLGKTINADVPMLQRGITHPVHCHYDLADTSRTTCSKPNLQNLRRYPGIRECIVPRPGYVFIQADFPQLELYTLAQVCMSWFGYSALGDMLRRRMDPHTAFAAALTDISYEEGVALKDAGDERFDSMRQLAKCFNFGTPGGLGPTKLVALAASPAYKVQLTEAAARRHKKVWLTTFPEMREYFAKAESTLAGRETGTVIIPVAGHIRGGARYNAICNTPFQGLGARCAKNAMIKVAEAQYTETASPLYGTRTVLMVHDELVAECHEETCHDGAMTLAAKMAEGANEFLPDVTIPADRIKPIVMRMLSKKAEQVFENGRLVPWGKRAV